MKNSTLLLTIFILTFFSITGFAQTEEATGYDGDNFSLEGALDIFKASSSPEDFEKRLNAYDNDVNNLDLNKDGDIDYISVEDITQDEQHALVLKVYLSKDDVQDIAVIAIEKTGDENAVVQILGDEDVYGKQTIVEPFDMASSMDKSGGPSSNVILRPVLINVWFWPSVRYIYRPSYRVYVSPWRWRTHPRWYRPWHPRPFRVFRPRCMHYHNHFRITPTFRVTRAHNIYKPRRKYSKVVWGRTTKTRTNNRHKVVTTKKTTTYNKKGVAKKQTVHKVGVKKTKNKKVVGHTKTTTKKTPKNVAKKTTTKKVVKKKNGKKKVVKTKKVTKKRRH